MANGGHVFQRHLLHRQHDKPEVRHSGEEIWPSLYLFFCLLLVALVRLRWFAKLSKILRSVFSRQLQQQLEREEIDPFRFYWVALNLLLVLNLAFLSWKLNSLERFVLAEAPSFIQFMFFFIIILSVFLLKYVANRLVGIISATLPLVTEYAVNSALVNQVLGVALLPCVVLLQFSHLNPYFVFYLSVAVMAVALAMRWYRGLRKGLIEERIGILQILSYFCALEILPVLVLVKYLIVTF